MSGFLLGMSIDLIGTYPWVCILQLLFWWHLSGPICLNLLSPRDGYEPDTFPRIHYYGLIWFLKYTLFIVFIHHFVLFYLEVFQLQDFLSTLLRVILSSVLSASTIVLSQYFVFRK